MKKTARLLFACVLAALATPAFSAVIGETGDAGDLPGTAQVTAGTSDLTAISGALGSATDVDMYRIRVTGAVPALFQVDFSTTIDSQLFIFDSAGLAVVGNDDLGSLDASITMALLPGFYYLAISSWDRDPVNAANQEIFSDASNALQMPINGGGPVAGYNGFGAPGTYLINVRGVAVAAVPEPGTVALIGAGLAMLGFGRRRRR